MPLDPTQRFGTRVAAYVAARPSYPQEIIAILERRVALTPRTVVADLGSGTGKLSELLLAHGCRVHCVEPNAEMRGAAETLLARHPGFASSAGRAEATTLPDASVDLVVAGQALHWFDLEAAKAEMVRIVRRPSRAAFVWNVRRAAGTPFMEAYEALVDRCARGDPGARHEWVADPAMAFLFGPGGHARDQASYEQSLDLEGLRQRFASASYTPEPGDPRYADVYAELERIFRENAVAGRVTFQYDTNVHSGLLSA